VILFLALRNGERVGAGGVQEGVLTILTRVTEKEVCRSQELRFSLTGLETSDPQEEHIDWVDLSDLRPGDEITIRVQEDPGDPPSRRTPGIQRQHTQDGPEQVRCSFCGRFRSHQGCLAGANVIICLGCRVLGGEMLERHAPSVFHLVFRAGGPCSFCCRPECAATIVGEYASMCSKCAGAVPFAT
jgi:hypothetical protein